MKRIIAFIILVVLVIVMIILSYNFYSHNNSAKKAKNSLSNGITVTKNKTKDVIDNSTKKDTDNTDENTNDSDENKDVDISVEENSDVPDTASNDMDGYVPIDHYVVSVDKSTLKVGEVSNIHVNIYPRNASEREVSYISSNENVIKVDSFGKMKAVGSGSSTITLKVKNAKDYSFIVNVK